MHAAIMGWSSEQFYDSRLTADKSVAEQQLRALVRTADREAWLWNGALAPESELSRPQGGFDRPWDMSKSWTTQSGLRKSLQIDVSTSGSK